MFFFPPLHEILAIVNVLIFDFLCGDAFIRTTNLLLHNHYFLRQHLVLLFKHVLLFILTWYRYSCSRQICLWYLSWKFSNSEFYKLKGILITHHIQECLLKGKLFTCIMFVDLLSSIFSLSHMFIVTCSDSHRWIPNLPFKQLSWAIIATSIEFQKSRPPTPRPKKNKEQQQKPFQDLKKQTSQSTADMGPSI